MNFFKEQELVRQRLAAFQRLFYLTVIGTAFFTAISLYFFPGPFSPINENPFGTWQFWMTGGFWFIFGATLLFIFSMSKVKMWQLRSGGEAIAKLAGGEALPVYLIDIRHKRLKNVVEEMSIASGIVPPKIFILPNEPYINAFAAGFNTHDAVIGVSQGCLDKLTREELQGVVAHEIGHIINGDMGLNLQLIGYLFGLMGISEIGRVILRLTDNRGSSKRKGNTLAPVGLALFLVGIMGYILGLILKMKISRNQEFGADAKAVQYTRNPDGIGGALKKIFALTHEFKVNAPKGHQLEHMYLYYPKGMLDLMASHPPLEDRIKKIFPHFNLMEYRNTEEKDHKSIMSMDLSEQITSSFATAPAGKEIEASSPSTETEARGNLKQKTLSFFTRISSKSEIASDAQLLISEMDLILGRLRSLPLDEAKILLVQMKEIIVADKVLLPREVLCYTLFTETLIPRKKIPSNRLGLRKTQKEIITIFSFLAAISSDSLNDKVASFRLGLNHVFPGVESVMNQKTTINDLVKAFEVTSDLVPLSKARLLEASKMVVEHDKNVNFNEEVFLKVLSQVLGVPASL